MAHTKVTINRNWYGKIPLDKTGKHVPKNLWPKRRKFSWEVRWYSSEGKRYSKSFKSRKEAENYSQSLQLAVNKGTSDKPRKITLHQFIQEHKKLMEGRVAPATLKDQIRSLNMFSGHIGSDIILENIKSQHAESYIAFRASSGVEVATANKDIRTLKGIFNIAIELRKYMPEGKNPFAKIKQKKCAEKPNRYVTPEEFKTVFLNCRSIWWKALLMMAYTSGGRRDELLNLTWADVDFNEATVQFVPKKAAGNLLAWEPKDHESRVIPIPPNTLQLLADMQVNAPEKHPYIFIAPERLKTLLALRLQGKLDPDKEIVNNLIRDLEVICRKSKIAEFTLHDLRRSCITNWAKVLPMQVVQKLAGHSNMETTRKYYLSVQNSDMQAARQIQTSLMASLTNF